MRRGVAHGDDEIARRNKRGQAVDIVHVVDVVEVLETDAGRPCDRVALGRGVAKVQIDEAAIRQLQKRLEGLKSGALRLLEFLVRAAAAISSEPQTQKGRPGGRPFRNTVIVKSENVKSENFPSLAGLAATYSSKS